MRQSTLAEDGSSFALAKNGIDMITFGTTGVAGKTVTFKLIGGTTKSITLTSTSSTILYVNRITKTNCGIAIAFSVSGNVQGNNVYYIFISKTNNGYTGVLFFNHTSFNISDCKYCVFDETSISFDLSSTTGIMKFGVDKKKLTTLCNLVSGGNSEEYLPNVFITPSSQYVGTECTLKYNGDDYLYNGYIALKD